MAQSQKAPKQLNETASLTELIVAQILDENKEEQQLPNARKSVMSLESNSQLNKTKSQLTNK